MDELIRVGFEIAGARILRFTRSTERAFSVLPGMFGPIETDVAIGREELLTYRIAAVGGLGAVDRSSGQTATLIR